MGYCGTGTLGIRFLVTTLFFIALSFSLPFNAHAINTGQHTASTTISAGSWSNCTATRLQSADALFAGGSGGDTCAMGGLGFSIPSGDQIDGIEVRVRFRCQLIGCTGGGGASADVQVGTGTATSSSKNTGFTEDRVNWTDVTLGSATDKWNLTWNATDFASSSIRYLLTDFNSSGFVAVDKVTMTVYYSSSTPPVSNSTAATSSPSQSNKNIGYGFILFVLGLGTMKILYDKRH